MEAATTKANRRKTYILVTAMIQKQIINLMICARTLPHGAITGE
jgi:hypothetical protein